jgi:two-component system OmpR family response regulator
VRITPWGGFGTVSGQAPIGYSRNTVVPARGLGYVAAVGCEVGALEGTSSMQRILVVEDDAATRDLVAQYLSEYKFQVSLATTSAEAEKQLAEEVVDLVVLDLNLPDQDGLNLARKLREHSSIPIVMLTGRIEEVDRVLGLELGADDYITKPFSPRELLARIRAVLRRAQGSKSGTRREAGLRAYRFAGWELRTGTRKLVSPEGKSIQLTSGEFSLLVAFVQAPRQILSRDQLLEATRLYDDVYDRSIDVQILRLRRKLEVNPAEPRLIKTERRVGYYLDVDVETA